MRELESVAYPRENTGVLSKLTHRGPWSPLGQAVPLWYGRFTGSESGVSQRFETNTYTYSFLDHSISFAHWSSRLVGSALAMFLACIGPLGILVSLDLVWVRPTTLSQLGLTDWKAKIYLTHCRFLKSGSLFSFQFDLTIPLVFWKGRKRHFLHDGCVLVDEVSICRDGRRWYFAGWYLLSIIF